MDRLLIFVIGEDRYFLSHRLPAAKAAKIAGFRVAVVAKDTGKSSEIFELGYQFYPSSVNRGSTKVFQIFSSIKNLALMLRRLKPHTVHFVGLQNVFIGQIASLFYPNARIINGINGLGHMFGLPSVKNIASRFICLLFLSILSKFKPSTYIFQNADDQKEFKRAKVTINHNHLINGSGVDQSIFSPTPMPDIEDHLIVGMACRLIRIKGVMEIAKAMELLAQQRIPIKLNIAGEIDEQNPGALNGHEVNFIRNQPNISLVGFVDDMPCFWSACHLATLPSLGGEGVPMSLMQPASMGRALVSTNTSGNRDICVDGKNGFLAKPGSAPELANLLKQFAENPRLLEEMGRRSIEHVGTGQFSSKAVQNKLVSVYSL